MGRSSFTDKLSEGKGVQAKRKQAAKAEEQKKQAEEQRKQKELMREEERRREAQRAADEATHSSVVSTGFNFHLFTLLRALQLDVMLLRIQSYRHFTKIMEGSS